VAEEFAELGLSGVRHESEGCVAELMGTELERGVRCESESCVAELTVAGTGVLLDGESCATGE